MLDHLGGDSGDDRPGGNLATRDDNSACCDHGMITDRTRAKNDRIGANPHPLADRDIPSGCGYSRQPRRELRLVVMGAGDDRNMMARETVVAHDDRPRREIEQGIHHDAGGCEVQPLPIAPNPDFGVDDRLDGGTELRLAEAVVEILLLAIGAIGEDGRDDCFDEGCEPTDQMPPPALFDLGNGGLAGGHGGTGRSVNPKNRG
jgi:hypothetical protein